MSKYIATRLHQALELAGDDPDWLADIEDLPHYVIDPSLRELLGRSDVRNSIMAMHEANIAKLPFPSIAMEMDSGNARFFFRLEEYQERFMVHVAALHSSSSAVEIFEAPLIVSLGHEGLLVECANLGTHKSWMHNAGIAVGFALLMMNVRGIAKEVIEPTKLNRGRFAKGKPRIPTHTVMRIGHVYDHNNERVGLGGGRQMPVHMRAAHNRHQHYGEGNAQIRLVHIPAVLVNFQPGLTPKPPKRIIAA